jgi:UDP-3-O-[3-hydroxymyristoyl] glucosamine N-acyltransferase
MQELSIAEIARITGGDAIGPSDVRISDVAPLETASAGDLSFVANPRYLPYLQDSRAGALLIPASLRDRVPDRFTRIVVDDPHVALYRILLTLHPAAGAEPGIHPTAVVHETARVSEGVRIDPYAVIGADSEVGSGSWVGAHVVIGAGCSIGESSVLHPHSTLYDGVRIGNRCVVQSGARLGREGFGFVWSENGHRKVPQVGGCILEDDVEVGTNVTIDRGSVGDVVVGRGTKIDSLVHVAHNVRVGQHVMLVAQVGIAGSTRIGDGAVIGGQAGIGGHLEIGAGARIGAQAGVTADVPAGETYSGYPARPHRESLRAQGAAFRMPELVKRVKELEKAIFGSRGEKP